ncbi:hypothetical protein LPW41_01040 [Microbacterium sp. JC 701]|uniref:hypothetical protein n=1 Tax=Microbacterium sp. JC 701 TaxID=2897389 RepID=UPI001E4BCD67|nr:hypothetical protein [Microbacterium sp. JC 701]MCD2168275.1 hypothetical protein [Microbacterium sp. JC 701]
MSLSFFDPRKMDRFRLVDSQLTGTSGDSWGIELVLRALAGSRAPVLPTPDGMSIDHGQYLAYWHGLHFLAVARLGWKDPGSGLRAWYDQGRPEGDPTLDFISSVWGADKTLDIYLAWATLNHEHVSNLEPGKPSRAPSEVWQRWARGIQDRRDLELLTGGGNPPHLGSALDETTSIRDAGHQSVLTITDSRTRRGVFLTGEEGFYEDLTNRWSELPEVAPSNWRIDVFNRQLGFIGTYRKSRATGRLHVGKHSVHMLGN